MTREEIGAKVREQLRQTIALGGGMPSLPYDELDVLINAIAAGIAAAVETRPSEPADVVPHPEKRQAAEEAP